MAVVRDLTSEHRFHSYDLTADEGRRLGALVLRKPYLAESEKAEKISILLYGREPSEIHEW